MNIMQQYTWKTLRLNRRRTVVTIIGVLLSAAMVTAVAVILASFISMMQRSQIAELGNWHVLLPGVSSAQVSKVRESGEADEIVLKRDLGYAALPGSQNPNKPYIFVRQFSANGFEQMSIRLKEGRLPQNGNEIALSETINNTVDKPVHIGDTLALPLGRRVTAQDMDLDIDASLSYGIDPETGALITDPETGGQILEERLIPGEVKTCTVVGFIKRPGLEPSWSPACAAIGFLQDDPAGLVDAYYTAKRLDRALYDDARALSASMGASSPGFNDGLLRFYGVMKNDNTFRLLYGAAAIMFFIIIVASVSAIRNAFAISVSERARQMGLLASIGATPKQKRAGVYFEAALIGAVGIPLGILAGVGGICATIQLTQPLFASLVISSSGVTLTPIVPLWTMAAAAAISAVTLLLSAHRPARTAARVQPIDAIRQSSDVRVSARSVHTGRLIRRLFGLEAEIALKNLRRSRRKYRATIASLVISIVLFLSVSAYAGMAGLLMTANDEGINYDIQVSYGNMAEEQVQSYDERIRKLSGVEAITHCSEFNTLLVDQRMLSDEAKLVLGPDEQPVVLIDSLDDSSLAAYAASVGVDPGTLSGETPGVILINLAKEESMVNGHIQRVMGPVLKVRAGDTLQLPNVGPGTAGPGQQELQDEGALSGVMVAAVTDKRPMGVTMLPFGNVVMVTSEAGFSRLAASLGIPADYISRRTFLIAPNDQRVESAVNEMFGETRNVGVYNASSGARYQRNMGTLMRVFVYGFISLISLICIANIFNTVSTNVALRRKEFAMLRSVGMTPEGFNRMIRFESIFYGLNSLLWGLPLSISVSYIIYRLQNPVVRTAFSLPWGSYAFAVGAIFAVVFATMLYSSHRFKRENIIEALREENL